MTRSREGSWKQTIEWHSYRNGDKPPSSGDYLVYFKFNDNDTPKITIASFTPNPTFTDDELQPKERFGGGTFSRLVTLWCDIPSSPIEKKE